MNSKFFSGLAIATMHIYLGSYFVRASYGKDEDMNLKMQKIAESLKFLEEEERLNYVRYSWRIGGYFALIFGVIFFIVMLFTKGEIISI